MTDSPDLTVAVAAYTSALLGVARDQSAVNVYMAQVVMYYGPRALPGADGVGVYPWPPSVDVTILPLYTRTVAHVSHMKPGETPVGPVRGGGTLVAGPETPVQAVPVLFIGTGEMVLTEAPLPGVTRGLLFLMGKHHSTVFSDGLPMVPRLSATVERLSDSFFLPGFTVGTESLALPPDSAPMPGQPAQLGPRTAESVAVHLRRQPGGWILGGTDIRLGSVGALNPVAHVGSTVTLDPSILAFFASASAAFNTLGIPVAAPTNPSGTVSSGAPNVKV